MTKIAFGAASVADLREWLADHDREAQTSTRYLPKRHEEMVGGSLFWIHQHAIIGRSPLLGFEQREDGRWLIRLEPRLIAVLPSPRRAHQGWRYLAEADAPRDLAPEDDAGDLMPASLAGHLQKLGLI